MRIAVIGQGSIGRRHAAIALELGHDVAVYDPNPSAEPAYGVEAASSARDCLESVDAAIVASPSSEHVADARRAIELGVPVLVEKPLALDEAHALELDRLAGERGVMLSVAMSMREHPGVRALAEGLEQGAVGGILRAAAWCGSWLPGWRPDADYRRSYSASAEQGGGVLLDVAVHELDYLLWLGGRPVAVSALARRVSPLETDVEDVAVIAIELDTGALAQVTVDYFDRSYTRGCRIVGTEGTLHWSWEEQRLARFDATGGLSRLEVPSDVAPAYRRQLARFLAAVVDGSPAPVPAAEAGLVLSALDAARTSSQEGRRVAMAPPVSLRDAQAGDAERLLTWRNDPETRRWSRNSGEVALQEHLNWFEHTLAAPSTRIWIAECCGEPVGQVRVGPIADGAGEVHVVLAPQARGRRLGAKLIMHAAARALAEPELDLLTAHVKPSHEASLRSFAAAGFRERGRDEHGLVRLERPSGGSPR